MGVNCISCIRLPTSIPQNSCAKQRVLVQIIERVLAVQPERLVRNSAEHVNTMLDASFKIKSRPTIATLASVLRKIHALFPPSSPDNPAKASPSSSPLVAARSCVAVLSLTPRKFHLQITDGRLLTSLAVPYLNRQAGEQHSLFTF